MQDTVMLHALPCTVSVYLLVSSHSQPRLVRMTSFKIFEQFRYNVANGYSPSLVFVNTEIGAQLMIYTGVEIF